MAILVDKNTKVLVQGITGSAGSFHAKQCIAYGTQIVAGVTPNRGGEKFEAEGPDGKKVIVPVFDTVAEAVKQTGADTSCIFVNIFGGIMKCDVIAEGVVAATKELGLKVPLVVRLEGTNVELGKKILKDSGLAIQPADTMSDGAKKIVAAVRAA